MRTHPRPGIPRIVFRLQGFWRLFRHGANREWSTHGRQVRCRFFLQLIMAFSYLKWLEIMKKRSSLPKDWSLVLSYRAVFEYARRSVSKSGSPVFLWGHSLGSSIAISLAAQISAEDLKDLPLGLILVRNNITTRITYLMKTHAQHFRSLEE